MWGLPTTLHITVAMLRTTWMLCAQRAIPQTIATPLLARCLSFGQAVSMPSEEVKRIDPAAAAELLKSGYKYLDVRTHEEFAAGHPEGAVNVPLLFRSDAGLVENTGFMQQVKQTFPDMEQHLVVGCKSGNRSLRACSALLPVYQNIVDNAGGFDGWAAASLPVVP